MGRAHVAMRELSRRMTGDPDNEETYFIKRGSSIVAFQLTRARAEEWARFYPGATIERHVK